LSKKFGKSVDQDFINHQIKYLLIKNDIREGYLYDMVQESNIVI